MDNQKPLPLAFIIHLCVLMSRLPAFLSNNCHGPAWSASSTFPSELAKLHHRSRSRSTKWPPTMRQDLTHIRGGQNRKLLNDAVTGSLGKTQPFPVKEMEACASVGRARNLFSSRLFSRLSVRPFAAFATRLLARGNSKLSPFTHSLAHSPNAGPVSRARAGTPRPHLSLPPSLPVALLPSPSSPRAQCWRRGGRERALAMPFGR